MTQKKIVIAGGSGFLGTNISEYFVRKGFEVIILSRGKSTEHGDIKYVQWDGANVGEWQTALEQAVALINLTGKNINCVHNEENKKQILESRVNSVKALARAMKQCQLPPRVFIQVSGTGFYGNNSSLCTEEMGNGTGFLAHTCKIWESTFQEEQMPGTRKLVFRLGIALGKDDGALKPLVRLTRCFLGGHAGSGGQYMSWFHPEDLCRAIDHVLNHEGITGTFNIASKQPVTNKVFMKTLRKVLKRPWSPPVPSFAISIGAALVGTSPELILTGQKCTGAKLQATGFSFLYNDLEYTLKRVLSGPGNG